ncbi:tetratricopeptide repeat protein [Desulfocapsa sulfexigens DSM 10523]|uniref:Tetratricopeptide repeat protein n=1 Tax=Desulfocapsa sulfexigens (strain DSM 10523 / SB164P1) TaxID=1167006 RepID=M1NJT1_DESSD|nr:tetratricopeptide repeat protein [Desulfocapsa sulfexigens]AGF79839.1 tetratricopeptide repeat protein [Desulfocapsa sulfexigens DSM 10523]
MFGYSQHHLCRRLERQDFIRFSFEFGRVIHENIPTIDELVFLDPPQPQPAASLSETKREKELRLGMEKAVQTESPVLSRDILILPFVADDTTVIAQVKGLDRYLVRKIGKDWLEGLSSLLIREFLLVKRACIDSLTGLLSSLHLEEYLDYGAKDRTGVLMLVTVYPKSSSFFQAKNYQHRTVSLLRAFVDDRFPLYYLGQSCFGILCEKKDSVFAAEFAPSLVNFLKREGCYRVHVGSAVFGEIPADSGLSLSRSEEIMRKVWAALHVATKRGPFAFCHYSSIENAANHPLAPPAQPLVQWLQKATHNLQKCALLQFNTENSLFVESVRDCAGEEDRIFTDKKTVYLLLPDQGRKEALKMGDMILRHFDEKEHSGTAVNCGISLYPSGDFKKSELFLNCRKALLHSHFLDPGALIICNALSCNIAGDMYYGDGDLMLAVKEYKRGLILDPGDGNLLNSLGVCYAQMNRHKAAVECFHKACNSKEDRFMALYNLGLEQQIRNEHIAAIDSFMKALDLPEQVGEEKTRKDIKFQLGVLCVEAHRYRAGFDLLQAWYKNENEEGRGGKALRYLGEACFGLGEYRDAMKYLQQAMRYNEYDGDVLGLLGEMYLKENEGDDIALRFCEKAVELNPDSLKLKLQLAKAQLQCGDYLGCRRSLQPCLRNKKTRPAALLQRGLLAHEQGQKRTAEKWFEKAESCPGQISNSEIKKTARYYLNK